MSNSQIIIPLAVGDPLPTCKFTKIVYMVGQNTYDILEKSGYDMTIFEVYKELPPVESVKLKWSILRLKATLGKYIYPILDWLNKKLKL